MFFEHSTESLPPPGGVTEAEEKQGSCRAGGELGCILRYRRTFVPVEPKVDYKNQKNISESISVRLSSMVGEWPASGIPGGGIAPFHPEERKDPGPSAPHGETDPEPAGHGTEGG